VCYKETQRRNEGRGEEREQETERHTQGTEPTPQLRPTQNTAEAAKATQEHKPTGTKKRNNHKVKVGSEETHGVQASWM
jgi:hypothetical protein